MILMKNVEKNRTQRTFFSCCLLECLIFDRQFLGEEKTKISTSEKIWGPSAGTGKHCVFGHLGLVFIWSCFVFCLLFLLFYVISAPVLAEAAKI